jgi:hypothetical protein
MSKIALVYNVLREDEKFIIEASKKKKKKKKKKILIWFY